MRGLDRRAPKLMMDLFWEDGWCEYGFHNSAPREFIDFCMSALKEHVANQHLIGNVLIDIEDSEAFGEVYFQAYQKLASETGFDDLIIAGRHLDRYEGRDGVWKFSYRSEIIDWSRTAPSNARISIWRLGACAVDARTTVYFAKTIDIGLARTPTVSHRKAVRNSEIR